MKLERWLGLVRKYEAYSPDPSRSNYPGLAENPR